jgi:hypothetical protein
VAYQRAFLSVALTVFLAGCSVADSAAPAVPAADTPEPASEKTSALSPDQSADDCVLCVASNPLLTVDKDGAASSTLHLCNRGTTPATLDLTVSDFRSEAPDGRSYDLAAKRTLSAVDSANNPILTGAVPLEPSRCLDVKIDATRIWQAGLSVADLKNGPTTLLQIKAVRYQVPLNIRVEGQTEDGLNVLFTRGTQTSIRLRNEDEQGYKLQWRLDLADADTTGDLFIPGLGLATIKVALPSTNFSVFESGVFRPAARVGTLTLQFAPGSDFSVLPLPYKQYPVAARLSYFSDTSQRVTNYVFILLVLLAGIGLSLFVNQLLPMQRKRVAIKQRLADIEGRLAGFAGTMDSRLLSLLRLEKKRLRAELRGNLPVFPQTSQELPNLEARITWLVQRVDLTSSVGELLNEIQANEDDLAVPDVDEMRSHCRDVLDVVRKQTATPDEIQSAQKSLQLAEEIRIRAGDEPSAEAVQRLLDQSAAVVAKIPNPLPADSGWSACKDLLFALRQELPASADKNDPSAPREKMARSQYVGTTRVVRQLELAVQFAEFVDRSVDATVRTARLARAVELLAALRPGRDASLVKANDIVRQIEQNVTKDDLLNEMRTPGTMRVEIDPPTPFAYQLVTFRIRFDRPGLDSAAAQDEIACSWRIDGDPVDGRDTPVPAHVLDADGRRVQGWIRGECFYDGVAKWKELPTLAWRWLMVKMRRGASEDSGRQRTHSIEACFPSHPDVKPVSGRVTVERQKNYVESRTILAATSLAITLLIVAIGLLAGAQEKLQTLDWLSGALAVLALGFGADTVKTLMSRT